MGQQESSNRGNDVGLCCTTRGDDEARAIDSPQRQTPDKEGNRGCVPSMDPPRAVSEEPDLNDGGTGGTGARRAESHFCDATEMGIGFSCVEERGADFAAGRRELFSDKSLKPKLNQLRACEAEVEALLQYRSQISKRLPEEEGKAVAVPAALEAGMSVMPEAELVRRLRLHEESLAGVPETFVVKACEDVVARCLGGGSDAKSGQQSVDIKKMKEHYRQILTKVDELIQERISELHGELDKLDSEVSEIEELISLVFDKMDEEESGSISSGRFVAFVCEQLPSSEDSPQHQTVFISPQDAESLFMTMSNGKNDLTYEEFKEEVTAGCLNVMHSNIVLRQHLQKRYRNCIA